MMKPLTELMSDVYGLKDETLPFPATLGLGSRRRIPTVEDEPSEVQLIAGRMHAIAYSMVATAVANANPIDDAVSLLTRWMRSRSPVRIIGAGRALLATAMPGNRLAHAHAQISFVGGMVPLPNSRQGGGIIACSASGKTFYVLNVLRVASRLKRKLPVIGIADHKAKKFASLCDVFIGIQSKHSGYENPLSALADTEEFVISELLDSLVVLAGRRLGFNDFAWRKGHEDLGQTGPWTPEDRPSIRAERKSEKETLSKIRSEMVRNPQVRVQK